MKAKKTWNIFRSLLVRKGALYILFILIFFLIDWRWNITKHFEFILIEILSDIYDYEFLSIYNSWSCLLILGSFQAFHKDSFFVQAQMWRFFTAIVKGGAMYNAIHKAPFLLLLSF